MLLHLVWRVLVVAALAAVLFSAWARAEGIVAVYAAYWAGLPAAGIKLRLSDDSAVYHDQIEIQTEGLPALLAIGAPSVASYLRLVPQRWSAPYRCWGRENREAAVRFVTGMTGSEQTAANCEVKCFDQSANPYLAIGSVIAERAAHGDKVVAHVRMPWRARRPNRAV